MYALLLLNALVVADGRGWVARADAGRVSVSTDGGATWLAVHRCGDPLAEGVAVDHAASSCPTVTLQWHAGALFIGCPGDGMYRWAAGDLEAVAVDEIGAITETCAGTAPRGPPTSSTVDIITAHSVFGVRRPPPPATPSLDIDGAVERARTSRWLPRISVGAARRAAWTVDAGHWHRSLSVELWVWLSWDLDRNHNLIFERVIN